MWGTKCMYVFCENTPFIQLAPGLYLALHVRAPTAFTEGQQYQRNYFSFD